MKRKFVYNRKRFTIYIPADMRRKRWDQDLDGELSDTTLILTRPGVGPRETKPSPAGSVVDWEVRGACFMRNSVRLTLPKAWVRFLGIKNGDRVLMELVSGNKIIVSPSPASVDVLKGRAAKAQQGQQEIQRVSWGEGIYGQ